MGCLCSRYNQLMRAGNSSEDVPDDGSGLNDLEEEYRPLVRHYRRHLEAKREAAATLTDLVGELERETFDYRSQEREECEAAVEELVTSVMADVVREHPLFGNYTLRHAGSHWDGTRVTSHPDEFDLVVSLTGLVAERDESDGEWKVFVSELALDQWKAEGDVLKELPDGHYHVDPTRFHDNFLRYVSQAVKKRPLPAGLRHGGVLGPIGSRVYSSLPAATLALAWGETDFDLTVDIVTGVPVEPWRVDSHVRESVGRLLAVSGVCQSEAPDMCVVPGVHKWLLTTSLVEVTALTRLGADSAVVRRIRALKLLSRCFLQWRPLEDDVTRACRAVRQVVASSGGGGRAPPQEVVAAPGVDLAGLQSPIAASLEMDRLATPAERDGDTFGVVLCRLAVFLTAVHRRHCERLPPNHSTTDPGCQLCADLEETTRRRLIPGGLHPALGRALREPVSSHLSVTSAYFKYSVIGHLMGSLESPGPLRDAWSAADDIYLRSVLQTLAVHMGSGGVGHPLLDVPAHPIEPISSSVWSTSELWTQLRLAAGRLAR